MNPTRTVVAAALLASTASAFAQDLRDKSVQGQMPVITIPYPQGAPSAPPQAPPAVPGISIYGIADAGIEYTKPVGTEGTTEVISGDKSGSRLGFRGTADVGDGWNAQMVLEMGYTLDTGMLKQGGRIFGRQAFVAMNGPYGTFAAGRIPAFSAGSGNFDLIGDIDPFLTQTGSAGVGTTMSSAAGLRLDNTILWASPTWNGLRGGVGHSFNADGNESPGTGNNTSVTVSGLRYQTGELTAGVTYDFFHDPTGGPNEPSGKRMDGAFAIVPTWKEQGLDVDFTTWRVLVGPKNMTAPEIAWWDDVLRKATASPLWATAVKRNLWTADYKDSAATKQFLIDERARLIPLMTELGLAK